MASTYKNRLTVSIFGQSHGAAIGVTLDGIPEGEEIDFDVLNAFLQRRAPGNSPWATPRKEADEPEFLSGLVAQADAASGTTCGAPITAVIKNTNIRPSDYANTSVTPRPGHADYTAFVKTRGHADLSGGGHFSGRLTAPLCIAGGICLQILQRRGISINARIISIGNATENFGEEIERAKQENDSVGGVIECTATGVPAGLGEPMFDGMENRIAQLVFAIPAVKGIEFGAGFSAATLRGSENNDPFAVAGGKVQTTTNHHGGILGGITSGMPIVFRAAIKPTPSITQPQQSVNLTTLTPETLTVNGRHDPCIVPRAVPCFEAAMAIAILDALQTW
ncbi:MAG: chorismate synthase [Defluviitaleaceae bacterium]|nr:chorismate synthase [Defluviitaleaceae bacterium]